jgi:hypothetical protein
MASRKHLPALILFLLISTGPAALSAAEAAPGRQSAQNASPAVQIEISMRSLIEILHDSWSQLRDAPPPTPEPQQREGTGLDPIGNPHG